MKPVPNEHLPIDSCCWDTIFEQHPGHWRTDSHPLHPHNEYAPYEPISRKLGYLEWWNTPCVNPNHGNQCCL